MRTSIKSALIIDHNYSRGQSLVDELDRLGVGNRWLPEVPVRCGKHGCAADNLAVGDYLAGIDLLFLHLGRPERLRSENSSGNVCSMELLLAHGDALREVCVVAFTGGSEAAPLDFRRSHLAGWHIYLRRVLKASALNIAALVAAWRRRPMDPPPLPYLSMPPRAPDFRVLLGAYRQGHSVKPAIWQKMLGPEEVYQQLCDELAGPANAQLHALATRLHEALSRPPLRQDGAPPFDAELHQALLAAEPWPPAREQP